MFLLLFALWVLLNGRITVEIIILGLLICGAVYGCACRITGLTFRRELQLWRRAPRALAYLVLLVWEVLKASVSVMLLTLSPRAKEVKPRMVRFHSPVETEIGKVILANSITLTPGTITCGESGGQFYVHALDEQYAGGMTDSAFVHAIRKMEEQ